MGEGSSADSCSELEGSDNDSAWLLLLLVSLPKMGDWLLPLLWIGLEGQSSSGSFFWTSEARTEDRDIRTRRNKEIQEGRREKGVKTTRIL